MKKNDKLVWVAGVQVREDQVQGRLQALARGHNLKAQLAADQKEEERKLADKGYSPSEIFCLRHANRIKTLENMGFGTITRCYRGKHST